MQTMEMVLPAIGEPETLERRVRELEPPRAGEARVRVEATGVSFAEQQMRRGKYYDQPAFPFVPGYDLVGVVEEVGRDVVGPKAGDRVAALTKVGGWAERVNLEAADLVVVPGGLDPVDVETVIVNGITAWRMLHRAAKAEPGDTIVVLGAGGGVATILVQLARHAGIRVIGTAGAKQHDDLRELGVEPVDYRAPDAYDRIRALAPDGVDAVFDHVGGPGIVDSWGLLRRGGALVSYGTASTRDVPGNPQLPVLKLFARLALWNRLPNGRRATFFNLWAGRRLRPDRFRAALSRDLASLLQLVSDGAIEARIARTFPLADAADALRFAEAGGVTGKVVLVP